MKHMEEDNRNYQRIAAGLQQRISQLVADYEGTIILLKEDASQEVESLELRIKELEEDVAAEAKKSSKKANTDKAD